MYSELCMLMAVAERDEDAEWVGEKVAPPPPKSLSSRRVPPLPADEWSSCVEEADEADEECGELTPEGPTMLLAMYRCSELLRRGIGMLLLRGGEDDG